MKAYNVIVIFLLLFCNCRNGTKQTVVSDKIIYLRSKDGLVKKVYDNDSRLILEQNFDIDTTPCGAMVEYYENGSILTWRWFLYKSKDPLCGFYFNMDNTLDTMKGSPYIDVVFIKNKGTFVKIVKPPILRYVIEYNDVFGHKMIDKMFYEPIITDSVNWINLGKINYREDHKYFLKFSIVDTTIKKIVRQYSERIYPDLILKR